VTVLLIGAGRMGGALLKGWLSRGVKSITVVEPKPSAELRKLAKSGKITLVPVPSQIKRKPPAKFFGLRTGILIP